MGKMSASTTRSLYRRADAGEVDAQVELARNLWSQKRKAKALVWYRKAARLGGPEYQMELGLALYWDQKAVKPGLYWIRRAAERNHLGAQYFLGVEFATGEHVRRNLKQSAQWYQRAARAGHAEAQYNLAQMYWTGEGVRRNPRKAREWLEASAKNADLLALRALSEAYETGGFGYTADSRKARLWLARYEAANRLALG
jgi:uncharacterized protein